MYLPDMHQPKSFTFFENGKIRFFLHFFFNVLDKNASAAWFFRFPHLYADSRFHPTKSGYALYIQSLQLYKFHGCNFNIFLYNQWYFM